MRIVRALIDVQGVKLGEDFVQIGDISYVVPRVGTIVATPASAWIDSNSAKQQVRQSLFALASRLLFRQGRAVQLKFERGENERGEVVGIGSFDGRLQDNSRWFGFETLNEPSNDLLAARDIIMESELGASAMRVDTGHLYLVEHMIRAIIYPRHFGHHVYKVIEYAEHLSHGKLESSAGVSSKSISALRRRANEGVFDQRHAPKRGEQVTPASELDRQHDLDTIRTIVRELVRPRASDVSTA